MTEAISKAAIEKQINNRISDQRKWGGPVNLEIARELRAILDEIQSGTFDLSPTDVDVKEIEEALNSEQANYGCGCNFTKAPLWLRQLIAKLAELESTISELSEEHNQKHARNERLEKELAESDAKIVELHYKLAEAQAEELASEQAYAKREAIKWNDEAVKLREQLADKEAELDMALKVLESIKIKCKDSEAYTDGAHAYFIAHSTIKKINGLISQQKTDSSPANNVPPAASPDPRS